MRISRKNGRYRLLKLHLDRNMVIKLILNGVRVQLIQSEVQWRTQVDRNELAAVIKAGTAGPYY